MSVCRRAREDVARDPEVALQLGEAADAEERLAHDQEGPALAEHLHRAADRTGLVLHHVTVSRWPCRSSTDTTTCCSSERSFADALGRGPPRPRARPRRRVRGRLLRDLHAAPRRLSPRRRGRQPPSRRSSTTLALGHTLAGVAQAARARAARARCGVGALAPATSSSAATVRRRHAHRGRRGGRRRASSCCPRCTRSGCARSASRGAGRTRSATASRRDCSRHGPGLTDAGRALVRACEELGHPRRPRAPQRARLLGRRRDRRAPAGRHPRVRRTRSSPHRAQPHRRGSSTRSRDSRRRGRRLLPRRVRRPAARPTSRATSTTSPTRIGPEHVALGSDFDGCELPAGIRGAQDLPLVLDDLGLGERAGAAARRARELPARAASGAERRELARQADRVVVGHQEAGARQHAQLRVGQQVERLLGDRERVQRGPRRPTAAASGRRSAGRRRAGRTARRSASGATARAQRARAVGVAADVQRTRGARGRARPGCRARSARSPACGRNASRAACETRAVEPRHGAARGAAPSTTRSSRWRVGRRCSALGISTSRPGVELARRRRRAAGSARRPRGRRRAAAARTTSRQKPAITSAIHSGVYGWRGRSSESPCSGRSGSTSRKRSDELLDQRLPLAVGEQPASAAARAAGRCPPRGRRCARRRGGGRGGAS